MTENELSEIDITNHIFTEGKYEYIIYNEERAYLKPVGEPEMRMEGMGRARTPIPTGRRKKRLAYLKRYQREHPPK